MMKRQLIRLLSVFAILLAAMVVYYSYYIDTPENTPEQSNSAQHSAQSSASFSSQTESKVSLGKQVFSDNCAVCHGVNAKGMAQDWRKPLADGSYPPPPLNGSAHTWHHSPQALLKTINQGTQVIGGKMPAFGKQLNDEQKQALLYYLYSLWPENIKQMWDERFGGLALIN